MTSLPIGTANLNTLFTAQAHEAWHNTLHATFPGAGLAAVSGSSTGHVAHHTALARDLGWKNAVLNNVGHLLAHHHLHNYANIITAAYGPKSNYTQPGGSTVVNPPGGLTQALIDGAANGTKFWLTAGTHRLSGTSPLLPKTNQEFHGAPGAIVSGGKVLTGWVFDTNRWYVTGQTQRMGTGGTSEDPTNWPRTAFGDDVFRDKWPLRHVAALGDLVAGTFFFDYTTDRIYVKDDPTGHTIEVCNCTQFLDSNAVLGVVVRNLVIEMFGTSYQNSAMRNRGITQDCLIQLNHAGGIDHSLEGQVRGCKVHMNGQIGVKGGGYQKLFEDNEVCHNNYAHFDGQESGGSKWVTFGATGSESAWTFTGGATVPDHVTGSTGLHVRRNYFHENRGAALWTDIDNYHVLFEDNVCERGRMSGIAHEISFDAIIRRNIIRDNGLLNDTGVTQEFFTAADGLAWEPVRWTTNGAGTITHSGNEGRVLSPSTAFASSIVRSTRGSLTDQELLVRVRTVNAYGQATLVLRGDDNTSTLVNGYFLQMGLDPTAFTAFLKKRVTSSDTILTTVFTALYTPSQTFWIRFQAQGTNLRVRHWLDGTAEPKTWSYTTTDASLASGVVRIEVGTGPTSPETPDMRFSGIVIDNLVRTSAAFYTDSSGIAVVESGNTWVDDNVVRGSLTVALAAIEGGRSYNLNNVVYRRNAVTQTNTLDVDGTGFGDIAGHAFVHEGATIAPLTIQDNHYFVPDITAQRWKYNSNQLKTWAQWQAAGFDVNGAATAEAAP